MIEEEMLDTMENLAKKIIYHAAGIKQTVIDIRELKQNEKKT